MGRKKNDGRGRVGGRQMGSLNKDKPLKTFLREHSLDYFTPCLTLADITDEHIRKVLEPRYGEQPFSQYDVDLLCMKASDRVNAELALLKYHTPQMQATSVDATVQSQNKDLTDRLQRLVHGEEIESDTEE